MATAVAGQPETIPRGRARLCPSTITSRLNEGCAKYRDHPMPTLGDSGYAAYL